jgi:antitoxin component of RelBE/YafQ-DinJ toxin-antitoxin module
VSIMADGMVSIKVSLEKSVEKQFRQIAFEMGLSVSELAEAVICDYLIQDAKLKRWFEKNSGKGVVSYV